MRRRLTILFSIVAAVAVAIGLLSFLERDTTQTASSASGGYVGKGDKKAASTTPTTVPDVLADPGVPTGGCKEMTYTPPTAKEKQVGRLCRPVNQRDVAVIIVHGGSGIGGSYAAMARWANRLNAEGYVTFQAEYHLFQPGGETPVFPRPEQNIKAAVQFLRGSGNALGIRKDRIVVQGMSAGARVGSVAYTTPNDPWFEGPELYPGISDEVNGFIGFYHPYDGTMQFSQQYFGGSDTSTDPKVQERYSKADALDNADQATGPAIFLVGDKDWSIIQEQQDEFAKSLQGKGLAAPTFVYPKGGHGFDEGGNRLSKLGEQAATDVLRWLNDNFPQTPAREAQTVLPDLKGAPSGTGVTGTSVTPRSRIPKTSQTTVARSTTSNAGDASTSSGVSSSSGPKPSTTDGPSTTSKPPTTTSPPSSSPPSSAP